MATRSDPSECGLLWRAMAAECARRFAALARVSWHHVAAGALQGEQAVEGFLTWFDARLEEALRGEWEHQHIDRAYRKGVLRAYRDAQKPSTRSADHRAGMAEQFLRSFLTNTVVSLEPLRNTGWTDEARAAAAESRRKNHQAKLDALEKANNDKDLHVDEHHVLRYRKNGDWKLHRRDDMTKAVGRFTVDWHPDSPVPSLDDAEIKAEHRGKGLGRKVLAAFHSHYGTIRSSHTGNTSDDAVKMWKASASARSVGATETHLGGSKFVLDKPPISNARMSDRQRAQLSARTRSVMLFRKAHGNFKGLGDDARKSVARHVTEGFLAGDHPYTIARRIVKAIKGISKARARTIARTEVIGAHAQGQLDSFRAQGFESVGLMAEWSTAKDAKVCKRCRKREGKQYTLDEAQGLIPLHPNCRCAWVPGTPKELREPKPRKIKKTTQALEPGDAKTRAAELIAALGRKARAKKKHKKISHNAARTKRARLRRAGVRLSADPVQLYEPARRIGTPAAPNTGGFLAWRV